MGVMGRTYIVADATDLIVMQDWRTNDLTLQGTGNGLTWIGGTAPYSVYAREDSRPGFGYVGEAASATFVDNNIAPDYSRPPNFKGPNG